MPVQQAFFGALVVVALARIELLDGGGLKGLVDELQTLGVLDETDEHGPTHG